MLTLKKILSALLVSILLIAVTGISFSRHICLSDKMASCAENENCCKDEHLAKKNPKCCQVQDFYFKANIVSTHDNANQKFFPENFVTISQTGFLVSSPRFFVAENNFSPSPPLVKNSRSVLLAFCKLSI